MFGAGDYAMRVWLDPQKVAARDLTASDVVARCASRTCRSRPASIGAPPAAKDADFQLTVNAQGRLVERGAIRRHHRQGRARTAPSRA